MEVGTYLLGLVSGAVLLFLTGFGSAAGKDAYAYLKRKYRADDECIEDVLVPHSYKQTLYPPESCAWVPEDKVALRELDGYTYVPFPKGGGKTFRQEPKGREYLMVVPGAEKL